MLVEERGDLGDDHVDRHRARANRERGWSLRRSLGGHGQGGLGGEGGAGEHADGHDHGSRKKNKKKTSTALPLILIGGDPVASVNAGLNEAQPLVNEADCWIEKPVNEAGQEIRT